MVFNVASYYSVLEFHPTINGERVNVGVFVHDVGQTPIYGAFITDLSRAMAISGDRPMDWLTESLERYSAGCDEMTLDHLEKMRGWGSSLQLTKTRASILPAAELLTDIVPLMLVGPTMRSRNAPQPS